MSDAEPSPVELDADTEARLAEVRFDTDGLICAVVQQDGTNEVLMVAWMDATALRRSLTTGRMWYWSRSRQEYWCKGETSGARQWVRRAALDCDGDAVLFHVRQDPPGACHTGRANCFFTPLQPAVTDDGPEASG